MFTRAGPTFAVVLGLLFVSNIAPATAAAPAAAGYRIVDLGTLGGSVSNAQGINDHGQVVGYSTTAAGEGHAFLWSGGRMRDLGTLGGSYSVALDINNHGDVVGYSITAAGEGYPFLWSGGRMTNLGGLYCSARAINDRGQVVGNCRGRPVLWWRGRMTDLTEQGLAPYATVWDINNAGQFVGGYPTAAGEFHGYRWQHGQVLDLGTLATDSSEAIAVNRRGQVAGRGGGTDGYLHAFLWSDGRMTDIGTLDGGQYSEATGLNNRGQVVGLANTGGGLRGFVWQHGVLVDLGVVAGGGVNGSQARDVNDFGLIAGSSDVASGEFHAVLWRPVHTES